MTFHVVCHDCPFESIEEVEGIAKYLRDMHRLMKRHDVEWERIDE